MVQIFAGKHEKSWEISFRMYWELITYQTTNHGINYQLPDYLNDLPVLANWYRISVITVVMLCQYYPDPNTLAIRPQISSQRVIVFWILRILHDRRSDTSTLQHGKKTPCQNKNIKNGWSKAKTFWLVVSTPSEKYARQNGFIFPIFGVKIPKNVWNHHPMWLSWFTGCQSRQEDLEKAGGFDPNKGPPLETDSLLAVFVEGLRYIRCYFGNTTGAIFLQSYTCIQW